MARNILALDQGTTSSKAFVFDENGTIIARAGKEFAQIYPEPGWVEHDPVEIWESQLSVAKEAIENAGLTAGDIRAIGITNQRETTVVWDRHTGKPVYNAIVWQCRRTANTCLQYQKEGIDRTIRRKTGLVLDAYFSGTKLQWILQKVPGTLEKAQKGDLLFGTIDTWLVWNLTGGVVHSTDYSNASRTLLYNIHDLKWDEEILSIFGVPEIMLPEVRPSSGDFGRSDAHCLGREIPICGIAGDQQAALFGQCCFSPGMIKNTYGTGCFMLMNTGETAVRSGNGLLTTIAWGVNGKISYALEGSIFIAGAVIQWLRDELDIINDAALSETYAAKVPDTGGVYLVPAFVGLGAPHWDMYARGAIVGITRGTNKYHLTRAAIEAIAYQTNDVLRAMLADAKINLKGLRVDGGAAVNNFLMQFQSDILQASVDRPRIQETTALGAAFLAGLGCGMFADTDAVAATWQLDRQFAPEMPADNAERLYRDWERAVERSKGWA